MDTELVALRRAVHLIERLLPYVMWGDDPTDNSVRCEEDYARMTLMLLRERIAESERIQAEET